MNTIQSTELRLGSQTNLARLGLRIPDLTPPLLIVGEMQLRPIKEIEQRALCMYAALCVVFEPRKTRASASALAVDWLSRYGLDAALTDAERLAVMMKLDAKGVRIIEQTVEALHALAWVLGKVDTLDIEVQVSDDFGGMFPNISESADPIVFTGDTALRNELDVMVKLDLYYCAHWAIVEANLKASRFPVTCDRGAIMQRRHALEWCLCEEDWDEVSLDT